VLAMIPVAAARPRLRTDPAVVALRAEALAALGSEP
jgi:hypothetical protein